MAKNKIVTSSRFPYLPIQVLTAKKKFKLEALLDTGYNGGVVIHPELITNGEISGWLVDCRLADNSIIAVPAYLGSIRLGNKTLNDVTILIMGDEPIIGREVIKYFQITLDHGRKIILEN